MLRRLGVLYCGLGLIVMSCSSGSGSGSSVDNDLRAAASKALPQLSTSSLTSAMVLNRKAGYRAAVEFASPTEQQLAEIATFLIFACHTSDNSTNFCADFGLTPSDDNVLSSDNLMGIVNGMAMKYSDIYPDNDDAVQEYQTCQRASGSEKAPSISGGTDFLLGMTAGGFKDLLTCVGQATYGAGDAPYMSYSKSDTTQAFIITQRESSGQGTYFYQGYLRKSAAGVPELIAYLGPSIGTSMGATVITFILNATTHRFILKRTQVDPAFSLIAMGEGGLGDGNARVEGHFMLNWKSGENPMIVCVDNAAQTVVDGAANCTDETMLGFFGGSKAWADVKTYLSFTDSDSTYLSGFETYFNDANGVASVPDEAADFPEKIE